jgi:hypothetical protein
MIHVVQDTLPGFRSRRRRLAWGFRGAEVAACVAKVTRDLSVIVA